MNTLAYYYWTVTINSGQVVIAFEVLLVCAIIELLRRARRQ